ncbi:MAG: hypothetical protein PHH35_02485 [Candidatus Pacebacteria bacterium]|jgi:hypothetical protein|nr:hypothetical protein [Candidatus Paceibacterota bacterium]
MRKSQKRGYNYEKVKARQRGYPKGGPGSPDYVKGGRKGEVKRWARPVDKGTLNKLALKGINEVVSKEGFTEPAKDYAKKKNIRLIQGKKVVVRKK